MNSDKQARYDRKVGKLLSCYLILFIINMILQVLINIPILSDYSTYFFGCSFMVVFVALFWRYQNVIVCCFIAEVFAIILIIISIIRYPVHEDEICARCLWMVVFCVPLLVSIMKIKNISIVLFETRITCVCIIPIMAMVSVITSHQNNEAGYNMAIGYALLFPSILCFVLGRKHIIYYVLSVLGLTCIVMYGSRGPLACIGIFVVLYFLIGKTNTRKNALLRISIISLSIICIIEFKKIIDIVAYVSEYLNISSRTINKIVDNSMMSDSGRSRIVDRAIDCINQKPLIGWGIAGDTACIDQYPHRIDIELMLDYGIIIGIVLCVCIVLLFVCSIIYDKTNRKYILVFVACGLAPLFFSHSYISEPFFWAFIGVCIAIRNNHKVSRNMAFYGG